MRKLRAQELTSEEVLAILVADNVLTPYEKGEANLEDWGRGGRKGLGGTSGGMRGSLSASAYRASFQPLRYQVGETR